MRRGTRSSPAERHGGVWGRHGGRLGEMPSHGTGMGLGGKAPVREDASERGQGLELVGSGDEREQGLELVLHEVG